jgi:hypothetical protein
MPQSISLTAEPTLPEAVEEALDALKVASSHAITEWIRVHRPKVSDREAGRTLEQQAIYQLRNERPARRAV